ncbi:MAG: hypothetical protein KIS92_04430 [Planctomycetota bacterium]|nr:hypothetical protein [Planctomycetota bacterium]
MTLTQLANELSVDKATVSRWRNEPWFPQQDTKGNYDPAEIRRLAAANGKRIAAPASMPAHDSNDDDIKTLLSGEATPEAIRNATLQLVARKFARGLVSGNGTVKDADTVARALEELRRGEREDFELMVKRGEYIPRDSAKAVAGALTLKLIAILNTLENLLASQVEQWQADTAFQALPTDERRRVMRAWVETHGRELRAICADEIDALIHAEGEAKE